MTETPSARVSQGLFARLPVGQSTTVRWLLIAGGLITAACVLWIQHLRLSGETNGLAPIFFVLFSFYDYGAAMLALGILVVALFVPRREGFDRVTRWLGTHPYRVAIAIATLLSLGALTVYHNHPLAMDEYAPYFQSQVFAAGGISGRYPAGLLDFLVPQGFQNFFLNASHVSGEVSSNYWPSFALLLTPFTLLGIPWACNPVLSALTIVTLHRLALRLFASIEAAGLVVLFTLASPVFFADGISYYSMTAHMLANALFALLLLDPTPRRLFAAGVVGSVALTLHNPVPHALFALPWFVWIALRDKPAPKLAALCAGYLPLSALLGIGWFLHSGELAHAGGAASNGVGSLNGVAAAFALPTERLLYARLVGLAKLLLWAAPCVLLLTFAGGWKARRDPRIRTFAASAALTFLGYLFVWADQGHGWGFRYFHSAWLVLPLLAAAYFHSLPAVPGEESALSDDARQARTYVVACALLSLFAGTALRASQIDEFISSCLAQLPGYRGTEPRVIVINGVGFYPYDLVQNDPFLRDEVIRMVNLGDDRTAAAVQDIRPGYRIVFRDDFGEVWSAAKPVSPAPAKKP